MPRPSVPPKYCHHKPSGRACVYLDGKRIYLGKFDSDESKENYARLIHEWATAPLAPAVAAAGEGTLVKHLIIGFIRHAQRYYVDSDGQPTTSQESLRQALRPLAECYGSLPVRDFGPRHLKAVRDAMIRRGWSRKNINQQIVRVVSVFKWGVEDEIVPPAVLQAIKAVRGLRKGRTEGVRETDDVGPAPKHVVDAILPILPRTVASMVRLQLFTAMRPGELVSMCWGQIERTPDGWVYRPRRHKTQYLGNKREIHIGPDGQAILQGFLKLDPETPVFSPASSERERLEFRHGQRKTPMNQGNTPKSESGSGTRAPGAGYTVNSYRRVIDRACNQAFPLPDELRRHRGESASDWKARIGAEGHAAAEAWRKEHRFHPHQLRHSAAVRIRDEHGVEAAQAVLGHTDIRSSGHYLKDMSAKARSVMRKCG